jgi:hypothetical protein
MGLRRAEQNNDFIHATCLTTGTQLKEKRELGSSICGARPKTLRAIVQRYREPARKAGIRLAVF